MKKKKTTIHDIARELKITASTVSRALNDHPRISDATKQSVLEMAEKLNYQPNNIAVALRKGKSNIIGVIIPMTDRNFFASVIRGVEEVVNRAGYSVVISQTNDSTEKERANITALLELQVDGILASYAKETVHFEHYEEIVRRGIPLVLFDRLHSILETLQTGAVVIDDYAGAFKATEHLIKQGCKQIVHFSGQQHISIYKERRRGYEEALKTHGLDVRSELILESNLQLEAGRNLGRELLSWETLPDAIFSASDYGAVGAMEVFKQNKVQIPEEIAIVGFSNEAFTSFVDPNLSTVDQHSEEMGRMAAQLFLDRLDKGSQHKSPQKIVIDPDLIVRESSRKRVNSH